MSSKDEEKSDAAPWNDEAKAAFLAFKRTKRNLPSPGDVDRSSNATKKHKNTNYGSSWRNNRLNSRQLLLDKNRALFTEHNDSFSAGDNNVKSSTMSENFVSMDVSDMDSDKTEVVCEEFDKNIIHLKDMIAKKEDPYSILDKIVQQLAETHKNYNEKIAKVSTNCMRFAARQNDQIVSLENRFMKELIKVHQLSEDRLNSIEFSQKCASQNNIVWLTFADSSEIEAIRVKTKTEMIRESISILSRMEIWNNLNNRTIVDAFTQKVSVKTDKGFENEIIMGIKFLNSFAARDVKRLAAQYAKSQFISKNFDSIRYIVRDNWSAEVWKLLRVCYELNRVKLIDRASVCDAGIQVFYKKKSTNQNDAENERNYKALIRGEADLDELRTEISDEGTAIPSLQLYNGDYFKMNFDQRNSFRLSLKAPPTVNDNESQANGAAHSTMC